MEKKRARQQTDRGRVGRGEGSVVAWPVGWGLGARGVNWRAGRRRQTGASERARTQRAMAIDLAGGHARFRPYAPPPPPSPPPPQIDSYARKMVPQTPCTVYRLSFILLIIFHAPTTQLESAILLGSLPACPSSRESEPLRRELLRSVTV